MKQIPSKASRGVREPPSDPFRDEYYGEHMFETNTDYLNEHAKEWKPPFGNRMHLHLIYARTVHWRVVGRASPVCKIPGRCYRAFIAPAFIRPIDQGEG